MSRGILLVVGLIGAAACTAPASVEDDSAAWRGTIATEGDVTHVVNESGSVWGGDAILVEEASIGVLEGDESYMLGSVSSVAFDGERILVADRQVPIVRVYDANGTYVSDIGGAGEGPGEYESPASIAIASDGRVLVRDDRGRNINVYSRDGAFLEAYAMGGGLQTGTQMVIGPDGVPYTIVIVETLENDPSRLWLLGMKAHGLDGPFGEPIVPPLYEFESGAVVARASGGGTSMNSVPFWPTESWAMTPELGVVSGVSTEYRFEVRRRDGSRLVVERSVSPVPVAAEEAAWHRRRVTAQMRGMVPSWTWNGPEVPPTKPPFNRLLATPDGGVWVVRPGAGRELPGCNEDAETSAQFGAEPCWTEAQTIDVFGADGRFLGSIEVPEGMIFYTPPAIHGDAVVARVEDADGTVFVKRYRRVVPGDEAT